MVLVESLLHPSGVKSGLTQALRYWLSPVCTTHQSRYIICFSSYGLVSNYAFTMFGLNPRNPDSSVKSSLLVFRFQTPQHPICFNIVPIWLEMYIGKFTHTPCLHYSALSYLIDLGFLWINYFFFLVYRPDNNWSLTLVCTLYVRVITYFGFFSKTV